MYKKNVSTLSSSKRFVLVLTEMGLKFEVNDCMEMAIDHNLGKMILYDPELVTPCVYVFPHIISSLWLWECDYCFTKTINIQFIEMYSGRKMSVMAL